MLDTSCLVLPIPVHAFFKQTVLQGQIGHDLFQGGGLAPEILHLARCCGSRCGTRQTAFAGLQEFLGPAVVHRGGNAFAAAQFGDVLLAAESLQYDADLIFRRILLASLSPDVLSALVLPAPCPVRISVSSSLLTATMKQKSY